MTGPDAAVLDANVLFPTVLREILADVAHAGLFRPLWSARILEEWRRAAARQGEDLGSIASAEIALLTERFPAAVTSETGTRSAGLNLPDPDDAHVIEAALNGGARIIVTVNLRDFPRPALAAVGLHAVHPDAFLTDLWAHDPDPVARAAHAAHAKALALGGQMDFRALMKRARLPRLARALAR
ncbi:RSP_2648 family PIN domain-containing protein [Paracoccus sp. S1E-3]|uniref:RSP_2648 family PIN domain-containing protein n=1 Tax=Paracoccus sp. S1E-3 TaxID=2756130 RepID=UPI0015EE4678|nr:PIN domain-containing protein [Paracoccus sp. S1E-3]MBA4489989.1 PIN domain-containing protein [Paracoccus sp. S1E-3]